MKEELEEEKDENKETIKETINNNNQLATSNDYKNIDIIKLSKTIDKELTQNLLFPSSKMEIKKEINNINNRIEKVEESQYKKLKNNYIKNSLNINIFSLITQLINTSTTIPKELKNNYPINNILLDIVKELMLTDLEIVYYSLYLDIFGWTNEYYDVKDNLIITALSVKKYLNKNTDIIENHLNNNYEQMKEKFQNWIDSQDDIKKNITITPMMLNERNNLLKKPFNCYCRNNFIDYNDAVDKILQLSLPYNEINKHSKKSNNSKKGNKELINLTSEFEEINDGELLLKNLPYNKQKSNYINNNFDIQNGNNYFFNYNNINKKESEINNQNDNIFNDLFK